MPPELPLAVDLLGAQRARDGRGRLAPAAAAAAIVGAQALPAERREKRDGEIFLDQAGKGEYEAEKGNKRKGIKNEGGK